MACVAQNDGTHPGEDEAFYEEYLAPLEARMLRTAWRIVRDEDGARDALQDALVVVWRRRDRVRTHPNPEALILRIVIHSAVDAVRKKVRRPAAAEPPSSLMASPGPGPAAALEFRELWEQVLTAVGQLPSKQGAAVLMRVLEERPYRAIAQALECAEVTARIHVMRGRARLGRLLAHLGPESSRGGGEK